MMIFAIGCIFTFTKTKGVLGRCSSIVKYLGIHEFGKHEMWNGIKFRMSKAVGTAYFTPCRDQRCGAVAPSFRTRVVIH